MIRPLSECASRKNFDVLYFLATDFGWQQNALDFFFSLDRPHSPVFIIMSHEILVGGSCYTVAEASKLLDRINKQRNATVQSITGSWLYYVDLKKSDVGLDKVQQLLQITDSSTSVPSAQNEKTITVYISPRNISPWSSKATSIAHVCGLKGQVQRIERGRVITIEFDQAYNQSAELPFRDVIHDRMTEIISTEQPSLEVMFAEGERAPLVVVDIFAAGQEPLAVLEEYNKKKGLALSQEEMQYLVETYTKLGRPPHDVELFMFAQVNSEYVVQDCRAVFLLSRWRTSVKTPHFSVHFFLLDLLAFNLTRCLSQTLSSQGFQCRLDY